MPIFVEGEDPRGPSAGRAPMGMPEMDPFSAPQRSEVVGAAFRQNNPVVSVLSALSMQSPDMEVDPNHNPLSIIKGTKYEAEHLDAFLGARNESETRSIMARIDREDQDRQTLEQSGTAGTVAALAAGLLDPTLLLPAGGVVRGVRGGYSFARSAALTGGLGALQAGISEAALQASQVTRTPEETAIAIAASTALSGLIGGGAAALLSRGERRALEQAFDLDRVAISEASQLPLTPKPAPAPVEPPIPAGDQRYVVRGDRRFVARSDGSDVLGEITPDISSVIGRESAPIRLAEGAHDHATGKGFGEAHIEARHGEEIRAAGFPDAANFVDYVASGFNEIYKGKQGRLLLVKRNGRSKVAVVELGPGHTPGSGQWSVTSAALYRPEYFEREELLWKRPGPDASPPGGGSPFDPGSQRSLTIGPEPTVGNPGLPSSGGAAAADGRTLELKPLLPDWAKGIIPPSVQEKVGDFIFKFSPTQRVFSSDNVAAKRAMADLAETALRFVDNERGVPTSAGGPPVSRLVQLQKTRFLLEATEDLKSLFTQYRYGEDGVRAPIARSVVEDLRGQAGDKLSFDAFKKEVASALFSGDTHAVPQVQQAAQTIRQKVLEPVLKKAQEAGLLGEDITPKGDPSYFPRVWNKESIGANRNEVKRRFADWYEQDQAEKAATKERIAALNEERRTLERQAQKLESRLATQEKRAADLTSRLNERAMEVRRAEKRVDTLEERAGEVAAAISDLEEFISTMRAEIRDPDFLAKIADLEEELSALRQEARPISQADLDKIERQEIDDTLTGDLRHAAEVFVGKRKEPRLPSFLAWMAKEGGVADTNGDVRVTLGDKRMPGLVRTSQGELPVNGKRAARSLDDWGEKLWQEYPWAFSNGRPSADEVLAILDDAARGKNPAWFHMGTDGQPRRELVVRETARQFEEMFHELGLPTPTTVKDFARTLNDQKAVSLEDLDRLAADMDAAGQAVPASVRVEATEAELAAQLEAKQTIRSLIDRAIKGRRSADRSRVVANARTGEARIADRASRGRLGVLDARLNQNEVMRDLLAAARQNTEDAIAAARQKIEDEIRAWKGDSAADALAALKGRDEAERVRGLKQEAGAYEGKGGRLKSADKAVDRAVKRILKSDRDLTREELQNRADETIDRILGGPDGRLPYDLHSGGPSMGAPSGEPPMRGSLKSRDFAIPTALVKDYIETDVEHVLATYLRTMLPDIMIHQRFGDVEMRDAFRRLNEASAAKAAAAKTPAELKKIESERQALIRDLAATRDRVRGVYGWSPDPRMRQAARLAYAAKSYNTVVDLGGAALNSAADMAGAVFRYGFTNVMRDAWVPFFKGALSRDAAFSGAAKRQARAMQIAVETDLNLRSHSLSDILDNYRPGSKFERGLAWAADKSQLVNGQAFYTDRVKTFAATVASAEFLRMAKRVANGAATQREIRDLAAASIDANMAKRIWAEFQNGGGEVIDGVPIPNTGDWKDAAVRTAFEAAIGREADIAVITPGLEKPLWMSSPVASLLGQFKAFVAATHERTLIAGLQQRDARTLQGLFASVAFGMLSDQLYSLAAGKPLSDDPRQWIKEGVNRSGVLGWFDEINANTAKMTGGRVDLFRGIGADKPLTRFQSRSPLQALLGPTAGKIEGLSGAIGAGFRGDWAASDISRLRRLMPFQNHFAIRRLLDQVESGANGALGVPAQPQRAEAGQSLF